MSNSGTVMPEVVLRQRHCRACGAVFSVCSHCDRGQCYCNQACRREARLQQLRTANRRYQRSEAGQLGHRMRQRAYRSRRAQVRVTDQGPLAIMMPPSTSGNGIGSCVLCGRSSKWIDPFPRIPLPPLRRSPHRRRRVVGESSKNYAFR
jgi:hypothetical protein